ncbi:MAG TPA: transcriptional repressor [Planktothrix sp.]|jgi:Fe2+ or Zn2+ uptake regulation protein
MSIRKNRKTSKRLTKRSRLFQILSSEPNITASQLKVKAEDQGLDLTLQAAYRTLRAYRDSGGKVENSATKCLRVVASILQNAATGEHLTAIQIKERAVEQNCSLHQATIYRVLARLITIGLVTALDRGRQKVFEWKRDEAQHGHLTCIGCGKTIEFQQEYLDEIGKQLSARFGYDFARIEFVVRSLCRDCR